MIAPSSIAHYRIVSKLGEGGMGAVYRATDTKLNRDVAIKILPDAFAADPDRLARFTREAQVLASLNHPNIAAIYGVEDRAIVLELVEGQTLAGPMSEEEAIPFIHQLIDALEYAHEKGIVHRDLKPVNIKITPEGRLKVLDFGLAKALASDPAPADLGSSPTMTMRATMAGVIMGTAAYMSPEQARGHSVDKRADIWSFGVVLYEMLSGRVLFDGETVSDTLAAVLRQDPDLSAVPPRFERLLRHCLVRDPRQRLRDISGARLLLDQPSTPAAAIQPSTRVPILWIAATAACAVLAAIGWLFWWRASRPIEKPLVQLSVDLGADAVADQRTPFAISPDGKRIVFPARSTDGPAMLAVREFSQGKINYVRGTEGGTEPFMTPDGETIGFFANGELKKIPVQGGAASVLLSGVFNARGAAWTGDGNVVIAMAPTGGLSLIPSAGGTLKPLTDPSSKGQVTHRWPQPLPGGRLVLFTAHVATNSFDAAEISALDLKSGQWKTVYKGGYFGRYLPSGHLLFVHQGEVLGVRFDLDRLETRGTPVPVLTDVAANVVSGTGRFDFSAAGAPMGVFGYMAGTATSVANRLMWVDASGKTDPLTPIGTYLNSPALAPDGNSIAGTVGSIGAFNVTVLDLRRQVFTSITNKPGAYRSTVWNPDGKHLVFSSVTNGVGTLWWARADGGAEPRVLAEAKNTTFSPNSFSPDGRRLAYSRITAGTNLDIWTLPLDLRDPENPTPGTPEVFFAGPANDTFPAFSPDGRWMAYVSYESGSSDVYVRPYPRPGGRWKISQGEGTRPVWARNGRQIFFASTDGRIMRANYETHGDTFVPGRPLDWTPTRVSVNMGQADYFALDPAGKRVLSYFAPEDRGKMNASLHVNLLLNFFDELKRRLP